MSRRQYIVMDGVTNETYTTPIATYDVNRFVSVSYTKMKRQLPYDVIATPEDGEHKSPIRNLFNGSFTAVDENENDSGKDKDFVDFDDSLHRPSLTSPLPELVSMRYPDPEPPVDVVIVGAGLSGLTAAYNLRKANPDIKLVVLEAKPYVGGRTLSPTLQTARGTHRFDLGDQWVNSEQKNIIELLNDLELETYAEYKEGKNLLVHPDGEVEEYAGNIYPINPLRRLDISSFVSRIESMREDLSKKDPTDLSESLEWDAITLEQFKKDHIWTDAARQVFDALVVFHFGVTPREMSLLFFCHVLNSVGGWKALFGEDDDFPLSRQLKIKGGAQQLCERLATRVDHANIRLDDPVTVVDQTDSDLTVIFTESGCRYRSKNVIVATSVDNSVRIQHKPHIPLKRECLTRLMPAGYCIKYIVTYEQAFWRKNGMSGHVLKLMDEEKAFDADSDLLTYEFVSDACACNDDSSSKTPENPALMGVVFADSIRLLTPEEREQYLLGKLAETFGQEALNNIDYAEMDWGLDRFTAGYPFSAMMPGAMVYHGKSLKKQFGSVRWCGSEMATSWYGFMEGSVKTGKRLAHEISKDISKDTKDSNLKELI